MKVIFPIIIAMISAIAWAGKNAKDILPDVYHAPAGLMKLIDGTGAPVLIIPGIIPTEASEEWTNPLTKFMHLEKNVYYHKWSKFKSLKKNQNLLVASIKSLLSEYESSDLTIIAYSAGGTIAILAKDLMTGDALDKRVHLHTVATPFFGYKAPKTMSFFGAPFVGISTIQIGIGISDKIKNKQLNQCTHWVNDNCLLDRHACNGKSKDSPQTGLENGSESMPCGNENTHTFSDENHSSILSRSVEMMEL